MSETVGDAVAVFLERNDIRHAFGVISIHNMPMLDAIARRGKIRFIPARSEGGAVNMADACARVSGLPGVAFSSTGTAAGNTCGALVEATTAGTPLLHLTGQIDSPHLDRNRGFLHEARDQKGMLGAAGKAAFRVTDPGSLNQTLEKALALAGTAPCGPVSVEIPIDIQNRSVEIPDDHGRISPQPSPVLDMPAFEGLVEILSDRRRVLIWVGGGARQAGNAVRRLADLGMGIVSSVQGRGIFPENDARSLGSFNLQPSVEAFYGTCDAMVIAGSKLRSNETLGYSLRLPRPLLQVDADPEANGRSMPVDHFVLGDTAVVLDALADRLEDNFQPDDSFASDLSESRRAAERSLRNALGPYETVLNDLMAKMPHDSVWVRDITLSNTMWGNRMPRLVSARQGVHATGGGIGQGLPMAIGASLAAGGRKTVLLAGDGGFAVTLGELATAVQEDADITVLLMNDAGYGVIRNIQDATYGGRQAYSDILSPDFEMLCRSFGLPYWRVNQPEELGGFLEQALAVNGPSVIEIDMNSVGPFARPFAGPPARTRS